LSLLIDNSVIKIQLLALIEAASFYLISQKLNKRYSGEQEIAPEKITPIYIIEKSLLYI
jgi:hypothetical protein